jgi:hypothetical protein
MITRNSFYLLLALIMPTASYGAIDQQLSDALINGDLKAVKKALPTLTTPENISAALAEAQRLLEQATQEYNTQVTGLQTIIDLLAPQTTPMAAASPLPELFPDYSDALRKQVLSFLERETNCNKTVYNLEFCLMQSATHYGQDPDFSRYKVAQFVIPYSDIVGTPLSVSEGAQHLFNIPHTFEHLLYEFSMPAHVFLIEKRSTPQDTYWIIYQSWSRMFHLAQWLGSAPWKIDRYYDDTYNSDLLDQLHTDYGDLKHLNQQQVREFLQRLPYVSRSEKFRGPDNSRYRVEVFKVAPERYVRLPEETTHLR